MFVQVVREALITRDLVLAYEIHSAFMTVVRVPVFDAPLFSRRLWTS